MQHFTNERKRGDAAQRRSRRADESAEAPLLEMADSSAYSGMLIVDRSGKVAPLNEHPTLAWKIPQGGRTLPLNQRFAQMWHVPRKLLTRLVMESRLRHALERNEMALRFQPQACLESGRIDCVETLVHWQHPDRGLISPGDFIPVAEETGFVVRLGEWALGAACRQTEAWQQTGFSDLRVAVSLSTRQIEEPNLVEVVAGALEQTHLDPDSLELQITESATMRNVDLARRVLSDLCYLGVRISMDDFGVGYSSLANLKDLPIHTLKIDRSLVRGIAQGGRDAAITAAIIAMARSLKLEVVADGVETDSQLAFLREQRCHRFQGYLLGEPMPGEQLAAALMGSSQRQAA